MLVYGLLNAGDRLKANLLSEVMDHSDDFNLTTVAKHLHVPYASAYRAFKSLQEEAEAMDAPVSVQNGQVTTQLEVDQYLWMLYQKNPLLAFIIDVVLKQAMPTAEFLTQHKMSAATLSRRLREFNQSIWLSGVTILPRGEVKGRPAAIVESLSHVLFEANIPLGRILPPYHSVQEVQALTRKYATEQQPLFLRRTDYFLAVYMLFHHQGGVIKNALVGEPAICNVVLGAALLAELPTDVPSWVAQEDILTIHFILNFSPDFVALRDFHYLKQVAPAVGGLYQYVTDPELSRPVTAEHFSEWVIDMVLTYTVMMGYGVDLGAPELTDDPAISEEEVTQIEQRFLKPYTQQFESGQFAQIIQHVYAAVFPIRRSIDVYLSPLLPLWQVVMIDRVVGSIENVHIHTDVQELTEDQSGILIYSGTAPQVGPKIKLFAWRNTLPGEANLLRFSTFLLATGQWRHVVAKLM